MSLSREDIERRLFLELELARARKLREEDEKIQEKESLKRVGTGVLEGAMYGAATLPAIAELARRYGGEPSIEGERGRPHGLDEPIPGERIPGSRVNPLHGSRTISPRVGGGRAGMLRGALQSLRNIPQRVQEFGEEAARTAVRHPASTAAIEFTAGAGAGAAAAAAREAGADPTTEVLASMGAGVASGLTPVAGANVAVRLGRWGMENLAPIVGGIPFVRAIPGVKQLHDESAVLRAARELQAGTADPEEAARRVAAAPAGVTPARATGEERLMALEARALADDPALEHKVQEDLRAAAESAVGRMREVYGTPEGSADWQRSVIQRVTAPGVEIEDAPLEAMLRQAYDSFESMYEPIRGFPAHLRMAGRRKTPLIAMLRNSTETRTSLAGDDTRARVRRWLEGKYSALSRRTKDDMVTNDDLLKLRSDIRARARGADDDTAELLRLAADKVTDVLESQMSVENRKLLRSADRLYSQFKVVDDAVFRSADRDLTPDKLLAALRSVAPSRGAYARGASGEMRQLAHIGRDIDQLIKDPRLAARIANTMDDDGRRELHARFVQSMMQRSTRTSEDGAATVNADALLNNLRRNEQAAKALGMNTDDLSRMRTIANELKLAQSETPAAAATLIESGPGSVMQLLARLIGVTQASKLSRATGQAMGGGFVLANFFSGRAQTILKFLNQDQALKLMTDAQTNPELYQALLVKPTDPIRLQNQAARTIQGWLGIPMESLTRDMLTDLKITEEELLDAER